jgi:predicted metal-dependent phosphoesterase TrpH
MRCDLHVHTIHSGFCTVPGLSRVCLESYNKPGELYETLKRRGMDLVTVTDHDSIDAAEELRKHPDFFLSEEVTVTLPSGTEMHAGVYGISERDHVELQRRRTDTESLLAYAIENRLFVTVNHAYSSLTGRRAGEDFEVFARDFHGMEITNGHMLACANRLAARFAAKHGMPVTAGSDSHSLHGAGRTFTEISGVSNASEFVTALRRGQGVAHGESGNCWKLTEAIASIGWSLVRSNRSAALLSPLFAFIPAFSLVNYFRERTFAWYWGQKMRTVEPEDRALLLRVAEL